MSVIVGSSTVNNQLTQAGITRRSDDTNALYTFTSFTFTSAGLYGRIGPTLAQIQTAYSGTSWAQNTSYLTVVGSGIQKWTVPKTGPYRIQVAGAPGGGASDWLTGSNASQANPGAGAILSATFYLTVNDILYILVGQKGVDFPTASTFGWDTDTDGGGGGGTFVAKKVADSTQSSYLFTPDNTYVLPLIVAGGGGGGSSDGNGMNATYTSFQSPSNHNNGDAPYASCGGSFSTRMGDWYQSGIDAIYNQTSTGSGNGYPAGSGVISPAQRFGATFLNGGVGGRQAAGTAGNTDPGQGGFGGGAGATNESGAGGGGWFGGVNGDNTTSASQGGTSYVSPDAVSVTYDGYLSTNSTAGSGTVNGTPNGYCTITYYGQ